MKATFKILVVVFFATTSFSFGQSTEPNGRTYAVRTMTLKKGADAKVFEAYALEKLNPTFRNVPGIEARLVKADRGADTGQYLFLYFYDSKATRDHYYPQEDATEYSKAFLEMVPKIEKALVGLYEFVEEEPETSTYTDYVVIE